ncbi:hypothetical protein AGMMS49992_18140 [Clostridia bacterium]|nr:hypothetical protein AGMMS49992_18140 [Clostridia bacterium]
MNKYKIIPLLVAIILVSQYIPFSTKASGGITVAASDAYEEMLHRLFDDNYSGVLDVYESVIIKLPRSQQKDTASYYTYTLGLIAMDANDYSTALTEFGSLSPDFKPVYTDDFGVKYELYLVSDCVHYVRALQYEEQRLYELAAKEFKLSNSIIDVPIHIKSLERMTPAPIPTKAPTPRATAKPTATPLLTPTPIAMLTSTPNPKPISSLISTSTSTRNSVEQRGIKISDYGDDVAVVQSRLQQLGYFTGSIDGFADIDTTYAIITFQTDNGLPVDGVVNQATWLKLFNTTAISKHRYVITAQTSTTKLTRPINVTIVDQVMYIYPVEKPESYYVEIRINN